MKSQRGGVNVVGGRRRLPRYFPRARGWRRLLLSVSPYGVAASRTMDWIQVVTALYMADQRGWQAPEPSADDRFRDASFLGRTAACGRKLTIPPYSHEREVRLAPPHVGPDGLEMR